MKPTTRTFSDAWRHLALGLGLLLLAGCSSLLFYPEPGQPFTPAKARLAYQDLTLTATDGTRLHGWWLPVPEGVAIKGTVLHLHGNGGNLAWHLGGSYWLPKEGYQVLMIDYRGYGLSQGKPTLPEVYGDIAAALSWLDQAPQAQGKPLVLLGQSLGGAMAIHYLAQHPQQRQRFSALVFDGVPASYRAVGRYALSTSWMTWPLQVPLSWLVPDGDSAIRSIERLDSPPKLFFHSIDDNLVPLANGLRLYQHAPPPRVLQLTRGDHVQTFADPTWRQVMLRFLDDPTHFNGLRRLAEVPNYPDEKNAQ
ncbi:alpha/beta hydrolase [Pseudomonas sp. RIT623]|uniref:alpha/beta hydrolase n=1 Tax=Pseudomonas sp. RIT623 TaxID=2559075 RepID=UPI0010702F55|nr:alpha/beta hydrolase [Pseudomonas sp. RIT623]TFF42935.1 alpha/beta hydrolase [Pseudomonas sp. RIT623]